MVAWHTESKSNPLDSCTGTKETWSRTVYGVNAPRESLGVTARHTYRREGRRARSSPLDCIEHLDSLSLPIHRTTHHSPTPTLPGPKKKMPGAATPRSTRAACHWRSDFGTSLRAARQASQHAAIITSSCRARRQLHRLQPQALVLMPTHTSTPPYTGHQARRRWRLRA